MEVLQFNTNKGLYAFQFQELETEFHSHPAIELLFVEEGEVKLSTQNSEYTDFSLVVIDANKKHKVSAKARSIKTVMIEHGRQAVKNLLSEHGISLNDGLYVSTEHRNLDFDIIYQKLQELDAHPTYDTRVWKVIEHLNQYDVEYDNMMKTFTQLVHLSESRLSHLFKKNVGMSIKKYALWCKLRATIETHLDKKEDLFASLIQSGFYDHPHFSRAFKIMLGVNPSKVYNSRTIQF